MRTWGEKSLQDRCQGEATGAIVSACQLSFPRAVTEQQPSGRAGFRGAAEKRVMDRRRAKDFIRPGLQMAQNISRITGVPSTTVDSPMDVWPGTVAGLVYVDSCIQWQ